MKMLFFVILSIFTLSCDEPWDLDLFDTHQESSAERLIGKLPLMSVNKDTTICTKTGNMWTFILNNTIDSVNILKSKTVRYNYVWVKGYYMGRMQAKQRFSASVIFLNQNHITKIDSIKLNWNIW